MRIIITVFIITSILAGCSINKYLLNDKGPDKKYLVKYIKTNRKTGELGKKPLIIIDGFPYRYDKELKNGNLPLAKNNIGDIFLVTGEEGSKIYDDYGKDGVVLITTNSHLKSGKVVGENILFLMGNKAISKADLEKLDPEDIEKIVVIKKKEEIEKYTSELYDGVVIIYLKNNK